MHTAPFDILLLGGTLYDGGGAPAFPADVGILGDRITAIGNLQNAEAKQRMEVHGLAVAPGFIDVHNHSDGWLKKIPNWDIKLRQGFTTEILMSDGISYAPVNGDTATEWFHYLRSLNGLERSDYLGWQTLEEYMDLLDGECLQNTAFQIPYANIRSLVCGFGCTLPSETQFRTIFDEIEKGIAAGAVALSTGLEYLDESLATTDELVRVCSVLRSAQLPYVTHIRYPLGLIEGLEEAVQIAERAQIPLHVSHLKASTQELADTLLEYIDTEARRRVDFSFDVYPYSAASTMLHYLLPYSVWSDGPRGVRARLGDAAVQAHFARELAALDLSQTFIAWLESPDQQALIGQTIRDCCVQWNCEPVEAASRLLHESDLSVLLVFRRGGDEIVHQFLQHPCFMLGSDGVWFPDAKVHPRCFGSAARLLGRCVRDYKLFSLEEAVQKMTSIPARRFALSHRGALREGFFADICVFNPATIRDRATYDQPNSNPEGIEAVTVNGELAIGAKLIKNASHIDGVMGPGRFLKRGTVRE